MFKKILSFLIVLQVLTTQTYSENLNENTHHENNIRTEPFAVFTIPKSGSHLLIKTLFYMTALKPYWHTAPLDPAQLLQNSYFPYTHCCLSPQLLNYYTHSPIKQIIGVRDLRDVCVSIVYQAQKGIWPQLLNNPKKRKKFQKLSFDEQLLFVINQEYELNPPKVSLQHGISKVATQVTELVQDPSNLICRFEDLVGVEGGGTEESQKELIRKIGLHIGLYPTDQEIDNISSKLFGDTVDPFAQGNFGDYQSTFRKGQIGSWKSVFKEVHKVAFKTKLGAALIALGYEPDNEW